MTERNTGKSCQADGKGCPEKDLYSWGFAKGEGRQLGENFGRSVQQDNNGAYQFGFEDRCAPGRQRICAFGGLGLDCPEAEEGDGEEDDEER